METNFFIIYVFRNTATFSSTYMKKYINDINDGPKMQAIGNQ